MMDHKDQYRIKQWLEQSKWNVLLPAAQISRDAFVGFELFEILRELDFPVSISSKTFFTACQAM